MPAVTGQAFIFVEEAKVTSTDLTRTFWRVFIHVFMQERI
jgi:hypothetical protein